MLPKKNRADKKAVEKIFKDGFFVGSSQLNLKYIYENSDNPPRMSFVVPKTVEKSAVRRNYLRRIGYVALKKHFNKIPYGFSGVLIFNKIKEIKNLSKIIENDINILLNKLKFIKNN
jgi:ribonuclease P protein component